MVNSTALIIINSLTLRTTQAKILSGRATYRSNHIPSVLDSHILSEQVHFLNEHIIQLCVKKNDRHQPIVGRHSDDDSCHNEESDEDSDNSANPTARLALSP